MNVIQVDFDRLVEQSDCYDFTNLFDWVILLCGITQNVRVGWSLALFALINFIVGKLGEEEKVDASVVAIDSLRGVGGTRTVLAIIIWPSVGGLIGFGSTHYFVRTKAARCGGVVGGDDRDFWSSYG